MVDMTFREPEMEVEDLLGGGGGGDGGTGGTGSTWLPSNPFGDKAKPESPKSGKKIRANKVRTQVKTKK
jgi:hypothetical protein